MNCHVDEQELYFLCDGLLEKRDRAALLAHCGTCPRCMSVYEEARRTLSILKQPVHDPAFLSPEKERSIISGALEQAGRRPGIMAFPKKEFLYAAAAALVILSVASGIALLRTPRGPGGAVSAAAVRQSRIRVAELTKDTTVRFGRACVLRADGADVSMRQEGPRVVHFSLVKGDVYVAAHKGMYDTIAVDCPTLTVLATGTHFSVSRNDSSVSVSVLEGTVKVFRTGEKRAAGEILLSSLETCSEKDADEDVALKKEQMPDDVQNQMMDNFAAMGCSEMTESALSGFDDAGDIPHKSPVLTRTGAYGEIRKLMRKGDYEKAITALKCLLMKRSADADVAYCDLALCYCKTDQWDSAVTAYASAAAVTNDRLVRESILHRTNHILFSKLFRYDEAEKGIRSYLALYPHGTWRQRELNLLARVERVQKRR
jgi:ferric-dicitrate binding protein FerR (iron transport regulator)